MIIKPFALPSLYVLFAILLTACSSQQGRYKHANDSTPSRLPTQAELKDATPRDEAPSRGGNKNYQVRGKSYQVLSDAKHFKQTGVASWYGQKFHGHLTSNGEIYNMYSMSAAHKNLPLPTYVKVTNLDNKKSVIVRVNDRGPFHQNRIIDLSYSAAYKLDMLKTGTANVEIKVIDKTPKKTVINKTSTSHNHKNYIQVFATKNGPLAKKTAQTLTKLYQKKVVYPNHDGIFRVQIGPISDDKELTALLLNLKQSGYPNAYRRKLLQ